MSDAREAAGDARKGCPYDAIGIPVVLDVYLHFNFDFSFH